MKTSIITTTVNIPTFVYEYYKNMENYGHKKDDVNFIIVGDNKTPLVAEEFVKDASADRYLTEYWSPKGQDKWLSEKFSGIMEKVKTVIPENDMRRRNFAYLRALEMGSDIVITVDVDNYPLPEYDWLGLHISNLSGHSKIVSSRNSFVNPCRFLNKDIVLYSRGFPLPYLFSDTAECHDVTDSRESVLNMGLWTGKPDVDSYTNLIYPNLKTEYPKSLGTQLAAEKYNYFPINTQNTAFKKELSVFHNLYMEPVYDLPSHRFDDIWIGLFCLKLIYNKGKTASFGAPVVEHRRNVHNYQKDLQTEFVGIALNTRMWEFIKDMEIHSSNYEEGFLEIADGLDQKFTKLLTDQRVISYIYKLADSMRLWVQLLNKIQN